MRRTTGSNTNTHTRRPAVEKIVVILFTGEALEIVKAMAKKYLTGPLFRTRGGKRGWALNEVMRRFRLIRTCDGHSTIDGLQLSTHLRNILA